VKWAAKLPGGPIKGFFIRRCSTADMVELMQRLDLAPTTFPSTATGTSTAGHRDYYGHAERGDRDDFRVVYGYVEKD